MSTSINRRSVVFRLGTAHGASIPDEKNEICANEMRFEIILEIQKHIFSIPFSCSIRRKITRVEFHHFDKIKHTFCRDREAIFSSCLEEEEKIRNQKLLFTHSMKRCLITQGKKVRVTRCTRANKRRQHSPLISPPIFKSFLFGLRIRLILPRAISTTKLSLDTPNYS